MAAVTSISEHPRRPGRYVVAVDGVDVAVVGAQLLAEQKLRRGASLTEAQLAALRDGHAEASAYDRALNLLAFRARSAGELRRRLLQKGESAPVIERVIERLVSEGHLNDAAFARELARAKVLGKGHSRRRLQQDLYRRGVSRETADAAIDDALADESVDERAVAERAARKRLVALGSLDAATQRRRLYSFLARRGYEPDAIREVMTTVMGEAADDQSSV